ncbi:DMT family transporter [Planosporangium thailandense]|uniref:DMT family transporter n=1 Tax=Planosporangium thailandense TaxID=765197 RepID=A0ABX0XYN6_9ACTN|nr:DMT family transporter [Planosporangium thailandense]
MDIVAVPAAFGSAICFAIASALEQSAVKQEKTSRPLDPRLIVRLAHRPRWLLGWVPEAGGTGLQALALNFGALALVEPILISGLFLAIPLAAVLNRRRVHTRDFGVVALGGVGLVAFLVAAQPRDGVPQPSLAGWLGVALWTVPALAGCLIAAWRVQGPARGALLGVATGLLFATGASLLKTVSAKVATDPLSVFTTWQFYALAVVGGCAITLNQNAFESGRIAVPLTAITITDPFVSVAIGVTAFHEKVSTGWPHVGVQVFAVLAMVSGIVLAGRSRSERRDRSGREARARSAQPRQPG